MRSGPDSTHFIFFMEGRIVESQTRGGDLPYCDSFCQKLGRRSSENEHHPKQARVDRIHAEFTSHLVDNAVSVRCCCPLAGNDDISRTALIADISLAPHVAQAVQQCLVLPIRSCFLRPSAAPRSSLVFFPKKKKQHSHSIRLFFKFTVALSTQVY